MLYSNYIYRERSDILKLHSKEGFFEGTIYKIRGLVLMGEETQSKGKIVIIERNGGC